MRMPVVNGNSSREWRKNLALGNLFRASQVEPGIAINTHLRKKGVKRCATGGYEVIADSCRVGREERIGVRALTLARTIPPIEKVRSEG